MKDNAYRQDIVTRTPITRVEFFFCVLGKFPPQICESCGATYRWNYETFNALYSTPNPLSEDENAVQINA